MLIRIVEEKGGRGKAGNDSWIISRTALDRQVQNNTAETKRSGVSSLTSSGVGENLKEQGA